MKSERFYSKIVGWRRHITQAVFGILVLALLAWANVAPRDSLCHDRAFLVDPRYYGFPFDALFTFEEYSTMPNTETRCYGLFGPGIIGDVILGILIPTASTMVFVKLQRWVDGIWAGKRRKERTCVTTLSFAVLLVLVVGALVYADLRPTMLEEEYFIRDRLLYGFPFKAAYSFIVVGGRAYRQAYPTQWEWDYAKLAGDLLFAVLVMGLSCGLMVWLRKRGKRGTPGRGTEEDRGSALVSQCGTQKL